jgi:menaquinone-9 beta-reductase
MATGKLPAQNGAYDVVIVGGGPAGSAAAIAARRLKLKTLIIERGTTPQPGPCPGWLGPAAIKLCQDCGVDLKSVTGAEFSGLRLWPWDLSAHVDVADPELRGWIVEPSALSRALLAAARQAKAQVLQPAEVAQLQLGESNATLNLPDGSAVRGSVVLIADGIDSRTAQLANIPTPALDGSAGTAALAVLETPDARNGLDVVLGAGRTLRVATITQQGTHIRVTLLTRDPGSPAAAQLNALLGAARGAGVLPPDSPATVSPIPCLAGAALESESHVGKRCLLVGDAGGFVAAFSNEGLYPALRSGWLAAQTAARALAAPVLQDELASFSADWRTDLAEYLRMPNTDLGLLLPMVFGNPQMSSRVARAFLLGQAF